MFGRYKKSQIKLAEGFTVTGHTGCMGTEENSLDSVSAAVRNGADIIEFDLSFSADGTPVLSHDTPKGGEVTLDEAFRAVSRLDGIAVNVDVKDTAYLEKVAPLAEKHGMLGRIFYTGINENFVPAVKNKSPEIPYYLNMSVDKRQDEKYLGALVKKVKDCGAIGINFQYKTATKPLVEKFRANGLLVSVWTVNKKTDMYKMLSIAPDNITTRRPDKLRAMRG